MNEKIDRTTLFWFGDHALKMYLSSDKKIRSLFAHQIILYDRRISESANNCSEEPITYVKEFYPQVHPKYSLMDLNTPVHAVLSERLREMKKNERNILFIGDPAELLFQAAIDAGFGFDSSSDSDIIQPQPFEAVALFEPVTEKCHLNLTHCDALFLKEQMPFEQELKEAISFREMGMRGFRIAYRCKDMREELNDYLWHYSEDAHHVDQKVAYIKTS